MSVFYFRLTMLCFLFSGNIFAQEIIDPWTHNEENVSELFKEEFLNGIQEYSGNNSFYNHRKDGELTSQRQKEDENYILDSTITYEYHSPIDSFPIQRRITGSNVLHVYDLDAAKWVRSDSSADHTVGTYIDHIEYKWDMDEEKWLPIARQERDFDEEGRQILSAGYNWSKEEQSWIGNSKRVLEFNEEGTSEVSTILLWDLEKSEWIGFDRYEYTYASDLNTTTRYIFNQFFGIWQIDFRTKSEIHLENELEITLSYNQVGEDWQLDSRTEKSYDEYGNVILYYLYNYNLDNDTWQPSRKTESEAVAARSYTRKESYIWNSTKEEFEPYYREIWGYDENLSLTHISFFNRDMEGDRWIGHFRVDIAYLSETSTRFFDTNYRWDPENADWTPYRKSFYYYQFVPDVISNVDDIVTNELIVFPNPVRENLSFRSNGYKINEVRIYTLSGKLLTIIPAMGTPDLTIPFDYPDGWYIARVSTDTGTKTLKIVK